MKKETFDKYSYFDESYISGIKFTTTLSQFMFVFETYKSNRKMMSDISNDDTSYDCEKIPTVQQQKQSTT